MEPRVVKLPGQDLMVERLKSRYGVGGGCLAEPGRQRPDVAERRRRRRRRPPRTPEDFGFCSRGDEAGPSRRCYSDERRRDPAPPRGALKRGTVRWQDDEVDSFQDLKQRETEEFIGNDHRVSTSEINKRSFKEINEVAGPANLASDSRNWTDCCSDASDSPSKRVSSPAPRASDKQGGLPRQVNQIYAELLQIYQKLQRETAAQQEFAEELQKRERFLAEREELLFRRESALNKIKGVKEEVLTRFQILKEQHDAEVGHLTEVLKERNKESRRLRSAFDALKELNDSLKKQLNEVSEENRKLEVQAKRVQARLDNLQRKYEFMTIQRLRGNPHAAHEAKSLKQEKVPVSKPHKVPLTGQVYELLTVFMDWISDHHLSKLKHEESGMDGEKALPTFASQRNDIQEKCVKLLPVMTEQLQWMPLVNAKLHEPFVKFIYWSLRQLDAGTQHSTMTSTLRRLGEDIFKGVVTKGLQDNSFEHSVESKPKTAAFFKSSSLPLRFLSTLIVLKTVTQADYLAQAFDSLCLDLKADEGKSLFLEYQAVPVVLHHLKVSSKGHLSSVIDSLLQMTVESRFLQPFLEVCSCSLFFRTCSVLLRGPKLDLHILEKLSIILQKLSKIKSNKKLFELFTVHLMLQEIQRTTHPEHAFLCINLNSTLFNLGLTKCNSLAASTNP
ncbi:coiled-coil domain-containing protein 138 isoform X2 [Physeter macrocephalus]|uniref:Coiled-coil domain-containing protein 138 isoform X2 n=1 Tax=Physeter macrocephalus TaxID=9755 RepID=A0A455BTM8_PHYMC|nr:coiled-coil domain-containing protein 138 isoform X2 [Physeter catodon]|eukprot:XP_028352334.1 coiled-coil domain-containing protein 138 isoform X2 [Physeter catodon]